MDIDEDEIQDNVLSDKELSDLANQNCKFDNSNLWDFRKQIESEISGTINERRKKYEDETREIVPVVN